MATQTSYGRLLADGLVQRGTLTRKEIQVVNKLTAREVDVLIKIHNKLGPVDDDRHEARPNFPL